jgi:hypothetical protein
MLVNGAPVLGFPAASGRSDAGQQGLNNLFSEDQQGRNGLETLSKWLVEAGRTKFHDQILRPHLPQVVSGTAWSVFLFARPEQGPHLGGKLRGGEALGRRGQRQHRFERGARAGLIQVDSSHVPLDW